ncbi:MFS transporter [Vibrio zhugei]|uniref:MFS transporter n=1 Tax=Vibrio zhugei TaxID=2479546 RepID=A0ABV7C7T8_9VIBR|nr:MFS transporter [Vibrio zhugei]
MSDCSTAPPRAADSKSLVVISLTAALMGIGQNGLLVSLPFLVAQSAFSLSTWSILIAIGSFLFLPSAPFWGRVSDRHGPKNVVLQALLGMAVSFALLYTCAVLSQDASIYEVLCLIGLIVARVLYGCTVSGMVPASQHWAIVLCGQERRLHAITAVSIGLSVGRLVGPLLAILLLKISPFAPLMSMIILPLVALVAAYCLPAPAVDRVAEHSKPKLPWLPHKSLWPFLLSGLLLCSSIALLQYSFSPLITSISHWSIERVSDAIGVLLTISAACTFVTQVAVIKRNSLTPFSMYRIGGVGLVLGFVLFLIPVLGWIAFAMAVVACSAALLVPAYTSAATQLHADAPGAVAGYISMAHTLGYGVASLLAFTASYSPRYPVYFCLVFACIVAITAYSVRSRVAYRRGVEEGA